MSDATADRPRLYGRLTCSDTTDARTFFEGRSFDYQWIDIDADADGLALVRELNGGFESTPVLVLPGGRFYTEPGPADLEAAIGSSSS